LELAPFTTYGGVTHTQEDERAQLVEYSESGAEMGSGADIASPGSHPARRTSYATTVAASDKAAVDLEATATLRYMAVSDMEVVLECKTIICRVLRTIMDVRLDRQMSRVLALYKTTARLFAATAGRDSIVVERTPAMEHAVGVALKRGASAEHGGQQGLARSLAAIQNRIDRVLATAVSEMADGTLGLEMLCTDLNVVSILQFLPMYQRDSLTESALELLNVHFNS
jgi:hypothetical protein